MVQTSPRAIPALYRSTVGKKSIMAVTGVVLVLYIVLHMVGNLKIFFGPEEIDGYSAWLRTFGEPVLHHEWFLWILRVVLLASVILHITMAVQLTLRAKKARPVRYQHRAKVRGSYAARTMRWGGVIIFFFVIYHVLDLTTGTVNPGYEHGEVYRNVTADFAPERWYVTLFYTLAVVSLGFHLRHGLVSGLQSLGGKSPQKARTLNLAATAFAVVIVAGFLSVPFAVTVGLVD
ncbi:succinate dehydrogenase cytochrome b subunit [Thermomonospora umbrina]|uniref:Succinate dehydrogenase / fumarate reductase cytochrome b subunit n=1 Tax=Thermomonospora umbrina TaxID=111806 RepID=A0A3D9SJD6_9ACTN|nr:succinate dehydrogenase cytochrome b subunit [Thermomonospora umbrina]REE96026.1 succinate dehydrogenase / fumarate reductase cytochrome b subunit [Thermomonospora umbrina]